MHLDSIAVPSKNQRGILFLANHTSLMDGQLLGLCLWKRYQAVPLIVEEHFYSPYTHWFFSLLNAIPIPNFTTGTYDWKEKKLDDALNQIAKRLNEGENIYLFPSGTIKQTAKERISGSSLVYRLLKLSGPHSFSLVRITGMWGSCFTWEYTGKNPDFYIGWERRLAQIALNGLFFMPKRCVLMEFKPARNFSAEEGLIAINQKLEDWFNARYPEGEPALHVPYCFWQKTGLPLRNTDANRSAKEGYAEQLEESVLEDVARILSMPRGKLASDMRLGLDLGLDSLDLAHLALHFETKYDLEIASLDAFYRLGDFTEWIARKRILNKPVLIRKIELPGPSAIIDASGPERVRLFTDESLESICATDASQITCSDLWTAPLSHRQFNKTIAKLEKKCANIHSEKVGLMLLNSIESFATLKALFQLRKIPILIDWRHATRYKDMIHKQYPTLPIVTHNDLLNTLNLIDVDGLPEQFIRLGAVKPLSSFRGTCQSQCAEIPEEIFLQFFVADSQGLTLKTFFRKELQPLARRIQQLEFKQGNTIALIHSFTDPYEIAISLIFLLMGYNVFFLSSYRISSAELGNFLQKWHVSSAVTSQCQLETLTKKAHPMLRLLSFDQLING